MTFQPTAINLPPMSTLLRKANCDESDLEDAVKKWEEKPPDDDFKGILRAEIVEGD
jgi:hypothetical protein